MKETVETKETVQETKQPKQKSPVIEKIGNFFFGNFHWLIRKDKVGNISFLIVFDVVDRTKKI